MMQLPETVLQCMQALENAGFQVYAVGGCVRDSLLGIPPQDYDLCTDASPAQMCAVFSDYSLVHAGEKHGTIGVVTSDGVLEITTFRAEGGYHDSRHPDWVRFVSSVEEDLARRDFTVNAMAYSPRTGLVDPWGGQKDLQEKILRTVGDPAARFQEDALRILRGVRFAVRFSLTVDKDTEQAMFRLAPGLNLLARERVFDELCKLLPLVKAADLLHFAPVLVRSVEELAPCVGFEQHTPYHAYDVFTHIAHVVEATPPELPLRWAALLHDAGKPTCYIQDETGRGHFPGHAQRGEAVADAVLHRLKAPTALRQQVTFLISHHMTWLEPDKRYLRRWLGKYGVQNMRNLIALQQADMSSKGTDNTHHEQFVLLSRLIDEILAEDACFSMKDLAIDGKDLIALGFAPGPRLGACLEQLLGMVCDEVLPNEKGALLAAAKKQLTEVSL